MKHILLYSLIFLALPSAIMAQGLVSGKVISASGQQPLPGASVLSRGTKASAITKADGSFSLAVQSGGDTLWVSYMGYRNGIIPVQLPLAAPLRIALFENSNTLDEVQVSTGYYELPQERATGSFTVLDNKTLNRGTGPDLLSRLKGVSNAILFDERVDNNRSISVRGLNTIYGDTQPLIVLNNFPYDGDIQSINPNDVESVTILKDAAAASIWGVRAANGVLVITTKKGVLSRPAQLSFNSTLGIGQKPDMFYRRAISSSDFIDVEKMLFANDFYTALETDPAHAPLSPVVELLIAARDGSISATEAETRINSLRQQDVRTDFDRYLYQNSVNQQYAINLQGGSDKSTYYYSAGFDRNTGSTADRYDRLSLRADHSYQVSSRFRLKPAISYSLQNNHRGRPDFSTITSGDTYFLYPYARLADDSGNPLPVIKNYRSSFTQQAAGAGLLDLQYVPLSDYQSRKNNSQGHELLMSADAGYDLTKAFSAQVLYQYNRSWVETTELYGEDSFFTSDMVNRFTQDDGSGTLSFPVPKGGVLDLGSSSFISHTGRGQSKY